MKNKILLGVGIAGSFVLPFLANASALSTTTLGTSIDSVSSSWYDYFLVLLDKGWPFILGASVLVGIVLLAIRFVRRMFHG